MRASDAGLAIDIGERSADQDLSVCLHCDGTDTTICTGVEGAVEAAVCIQPRNAVAGSTAHHSEISADQDLPVRLHCN